MQWFAGRMVWVEGGQQGRGAEMGRARSKGSRMEERASERARASRASLLLWSATHLLPRRRAHYEGDAAPKASPSANPHVTALRGHHLIAGDGRLEPDLGGGHTSVKAPQGASTVAASHE